MESLVPLQEPEAQEVMQLPQADGTEVQGPTEHLIQAKRPLQEAAEPATAPQAQEVAELMAALNHAQGAEAQGPSSLTRQRLGATCCCCLQQS